MSVEISAFYTITAPTGVDGRGEIAVLNDVASANFCGFVTEISGLDSPLVRPVSEDIVEGDGAVNSSFYYGAREFTFELLFDPNLGTNLNARIDKFLRATNAMRSTGSIVWTETGSVAKLLNFRRAQPVRISDRRPKRCLFAGVSADPRIVSNAETTTALNASVTNLGNAGYLPRFSITTPNNPVLTNTTTGQSFSLTLTGGTVLVDFANHTVTQAGVSRYSSVNFSTSTWWELAPGANVITISGGSSAGSMIWRSAWI